MTRRFVYDECTNTMKLCLLPCFVSSNKSYGLCSYIRFGSNVLFVFATFFLTENIGLDWTLAKFCLKWIQKSHQMMKFKLFSNSS